MRILTGKDIRLADSFTIRDKGLGEGELMERAARAIVSEVAGLIPEYGFAEDTDFTVFAGKGDNAADGRLVASLLADGGYACRVIGPDDFAGYLAVQSGRKASKNEIYIDALLGTGLCGPARGLPRDMIRHINASGAFVISIDVPSGMPSEPFVPDGMFDDGDIVNADITVTVEFPKLSMLLPRFGNHAGKIAVAHIGLSEGFAASGPEKYFYTDDCAYGEFEANEPALGKPKKFAHKGDNGHLLAVCGRAGMSGAAILAAGASLRSGCGLVTVHMPCSERLAMHVAHPSAIVDGDAEECFTSLPDDMSKYSAVCVGCGLGTDERSVPALVSLFSCGKPMLIDADALNLVSEFGYLRDAIPAGSVLTPHLGELRRLVGDWCGEEEKLDKVSALAAGLSSVIVVKGAHTMVVSDDGRMFFNSTGTPGMAKGGSGDVLAGYVGGLLARGCAPLTAAVVGVYRHGLAAEAAERRFGTESMNSSDIVDCL